jgi:hypothetical protein
MTMRQEGAHLKNGLDSRLRENNEHLANLVTHHFDRTLGAMLRFMLHLYSFNKTTGVISMTTAPQQLIEKIKRLQPQRITEVEDFVDFLCARDDEKTLIRAAAQTSEPSFLAVWDNDADAVYDRM